MDQLAQKMEKNQQQMEQEQAEEDMDALRALLENLLRMSFDQEQLMTDLKGWTSTTRSSSAPVRTTPVERQRPRDRRFALRPLKRVMQIQAKGEPGDRRDQPQHGRSDRQPGRTQRAAGAEAVSSS